MNRKLCFFLFCPLLLILAGCEKRTTTAPLASNSSGAQIQACGLITKEEVQAVQGSAVNEVKSSVNTEGAFRVAQCFYTAAESNKSVSLSVTTNNPDNPAKRSPKDFWRDTFDRSNAEGKKEKSESLRDEPRGTEEEEKSTPPKEIDGLGDEAYWTGNRVGGALYVLKKDVFIRISVGGPDNEETRINKSKALADKAISRL